MGTGKKYGVWTADKEWVEDFRNPILAKDLAWEIGGFVIDITGLPDDVPDIDFSFFTPLFDYRNSNKST